MKSSVLAAGLLGLAALGGLGAWPSRAGASPYPSYYTPRQWGGGYYYRRYHYYSPAHGEYRYHVAVYYPGRPRYVYYYNPYKRRYWGRYDLVAGGYALLAEQDRKPTLAEIPESAFPPPGPMPPAEPGGDPMLPPPEGGLGLPPAGPGTPGCERMPSCSDDRP
jgi:hypothetical protein